MSWEDCGFKPGTIFGPTQCEHVCGDCDGEHHFLITSDAQQAEMNGEEWPADKEPTNYFVCKHCPTTATMVDDDSAWEVDA
jgi:hypothetical protein